MAEIKGFRAEQNDCGTFKPLIASISCNLCWACSYTGCSSYAATPTTEDKQTNHKHLNERNKPMNKTIRNLAIAALFVFPGISGFPQEVRQDEAPAVQPVVVENVAFPILVGIP